MNIHPSMISSILPDIKSYVKENTRAMLGIDMKQYFNELSNLSIKQSIYTSMEEFCKHIGKFNSEPLVIPTNCNREMNKTNEENELVNEFVTKKFNTVSYIIEYIEVTIFNKM